MNVGDLETQLRECLSVSAEGQDPLPNTVRALVRMLRQEMREMIAETKWQVVDDDSLRGFHVRLVPPPEPTDCLDPVNPKKTRLPRVSFTEAIGRVAASLPSDDCTAGILIGTPFGGPSDPDVGPANQPPWHSCWHEVENGTRSVLCEGENCTDPGHRDGPAKEASTPTWSVDTSPAAPRTPDLAERLRYDCERLGRQGLQPITRMLLDVAATELESLRAALQPFADYAECLPPLESVERVTDDAGVAMNTYVRLKNYNIRFGDLRRARAALYPVEPKKPGTT